MHNILEVSAICRKTTAKTNNDDTVALFLSVDGTFNPPEVAAQLVIVEYENTFFEQNRFNSRITVYLSTTKGSLLDLRRT